MHHIAYSFLVISDAALTVISNCLKMLGVMTAGIMTVLGTLSETKTEDKKQLTVHGRVILVAGLLGVLIALVGQSIEWIASDKKSQEDEAKNQKVLREIERSLTRLSDLSVDAAIRIPLNDGSNPGIRQLVLEDLKMYDRNNPNAASNRIVVENGFERVNQDTLVSTNLVQEYYSVDSADLEASRQFKLLIAYSHVSIAIFKNPIDPRRFKLDGDNRTEPDMLIVPGAGELNVGVSREYFHASAAHPQTLEFYAYRSNMPVSSTSWNASKKMDSLDDLNGAQVFVYSDDSYPGARFSSNRFTMSPPVIGLTINHHRINLEGLKLVTDGQEDCFVTTLPYNLAGH